MITTDVDLPEMWLTVSRRQPVLFHCGIRSALLMTTRTVAMTRKLPQLHRPVAQVRFPQRAARDTAASSPELLSRAATESSRDSAAGGMGEVFRADDLSLGQSVALKFLPRSAQPRPRRSSPVSKRDSSRAAGLASECLPRARYRRVRRADLPVDGIRRWRGSASLLRRIGRLPEDKALEIARKLCAGLAAAHDKGVLHRDLKPGNVMLDGRGQVLLTDFGLAGLAHEIAGNEVRSGTPAYMAPEQLDGKEVTPKSDIYALGLVLYELFTGKRPFGEVQSVQELVEAQKRNTPSSISSVVRDIDPTVEGIVRRCLDPDPARRPASALSVAAALPGGDPLHAALMAGETPSPELVAAAGEDVGLRLRTAVPLLAFVLLALGGHAYVSANNSLLDKVRPGMSPDVLRFQARKLVGELGLTRGTDSVDGFVWGSDYLRWIPEHEKPPRWDDVTKGRAPVLRYWYREAPETLTGIAFHDDLLTLGVPAPDDPPPTMSGSIYIELDEQGHLIEFRSVPAQRLNEPTVPRETDWSPLFRAAGIDPAKMQRTDPLWTWIETSDTRTAWTGVWPGSQTPLRIEAAALGGRPVAFSLIGPWVKPLRMPSSGHDDPKLILICIILVIVLGSSVFLARKHLLEGRGDSRGAFRIGAVMFALHMLLWATRMHYHFGLGLLGYLFVAIATASGFAVVVWCLYLALEPFVRRYWPEALISSTRVLSGQIRDGIVGRDVLIGIAVACLWQVFFAVHYLVVPG